MVDISNSATITEKSEDFSENVCIYSGGIYEKYGVKLLAQAFEKINKDNCFLHIYGSGDLEKYFKQNVFKKVKYFGTVSNEKMMQQQKNAVLLINPRFTKEEYTK